MRATAEGDGMVESREGHREDGREPLAKAWAWPWGVAVVVVLTLVWMILPGGGGAGWLWLPIAFAVGVYVSWQSWAPGRRIFPST